jgi:hypothetical protein
LGDKIGVSLQALLQTAAPPLAKKTHAEMTRRYLATWSAADSFIRLFVSLLFRSNFAVTRKKFPVLSRRKACGKPSKCAVLGVHCPQAGPRNYEIPCKVPVYQGIAIRDGFAADCVHSQSYQYVASRVRN